VAVEENGPFAADLKGKVREATRINNAALELAAANYWQRNVLY
jgi:hypothetical protein